MGYSFHTVRKSLKPISYLLFSKLAIHFKETRIQYKNTSDVNIAGQILLHYK